MILRYPWFLLLLLLMPLLVWLRFHSARRVFFPYSDSHILRRLPQTWAVLAGRALPVFYTLGLVCLILALSRPQKALDERLVHTDVVDIVLLVDISTSMRAMDFTTSQKEMNRLDAAKQVIEEFVANRPQDRIGMVAFAALPYAVSPLTLDHGWLVQRMQDIHTGMIEDGTAIGSAIASAVNRLRESQAKSKLVILLTDGVNNRGKITPLNAAEAAKAFDIKVYTIGAGTDKGVAPYPHSGFFGRKQYINQPVEIDEKTLKEIASITGARYFRATDLARLKDIYQEIDEMERTEIDVEQFTRYEERFMPFVVAAMLLLTLERVLSFTRIGRLF